MTNSSSVQKLRLLLITALVAIAGVVSGLFYASNFSNHHAGADESQSVFNLVMAPQSLDELVQRADVIVIGKVGKIVHQGAFWGYGKDDAARSSRADDPVSGALPIMDYQIDVEQVLLDDGVLSSGKPLILRVIQAPTDKDIYGGSHNVFFLTINPDNATYGPFYGFTGIVPVDSPDVRGLTGAALPFAENTRPYDFVEQVRIVVNKMKGMDAK